MTPTDDFRTVVESYWAAAESRDWSAFGATLAPEVIYDLPQTRERIRGREALVRFNREYPGDWHIRIDRLVVDGDSAVTWVHATVGLDEMYAISFFTADEEGRITSVTDFWPEPYEPPPGRRHLAERY